MSTPMDLSTFLAAPDADVAEVAPETVIAAFGGVRRSAALEGIDRHSPAYMAWQRAGLVANVDLIFRHGVRHVIYPLAIGEHLAEAGPYRAQVFKGLEWGLAGAAALADYAERGWRVRLIGPVPELAGTSERLRAATPTADAPTLWIWASADADGPLEEIFAAVQRTGARARADLARALYGEAIPPATLLLGFGSPQFSYDLIPPLLTTRLEGYWVQRPGYRLDQPMLRRILYDYAYLRRTGRGVERNDRYANVQAQRAAWLTDWVLGVGIDLEGFWYPAPFAGPEA
jgi:hypothetical protein